MKHTPAEIAHLMGCTYGQAEVMLAAPDLLEALEAIAGGRTLIMDHTGETFAEALQRDALAAIAKVKRGHWLERPHAPRGSGEA